MANGKPGVPKGTINNPKGANQHAPGKGEGEKDTFLIVRISSTDKQKLKKAARKKKTTLSNWVLSLALEAAET